MSGVELSGLMEPISLLLYVVWRCAWIEVRAVDASGKDEWLRKEGLAQRAVNTLLSLSERILAGSLDDFQLGAGTDFSQVGLFFIACLCIDPGFVFRLLLRESATSRWQLLF